MKKIIRLLPFAVLFVTCVSEPIVDLDIRLEKRLKEVSRTGEIDYFIFPDSDDYLNLPNQDVKNPVTEAKAELGKLLFFETGIAQDPFDENSLETYSCSSCHIPAAGFTPGRFQGVADGAIGFGRGRQKAPDYGDFEVDAQGLRPLSVLNSGYSSNGLWSGGFGSFGVNEGTEDLWHHREDFEVNFEQLQGLEAQNIEGLATHRMVVNDKMLNEYGYRELFDNAFPDHDVSERYSVRNVSFALSAYLRTLYAQKAPFQQWLKGEKNALTEEEKLGAMVFLEKANCTNCHNGPAFNNMAFHALGVADMMQVHPYALNTTLDEPRNLGRGFFTGNTEDNYKFKVPQLYNLKNYSHYFHGSSKTTLEEVVDYKIEATSENPNVSQDLLSPLFNPITLTTEERDALLTFLRDGLYDPNLFRFQPEALLSGNCFPNNDKASKAILGCD